MSTGFRSAAFLGLAAAVSAALFLSVNNVLTPQIYRHGGSPITLEVLRYLGLVIATGSWVALFARSDKCTAREFRMCLVVGAIYACAAAALLTAISHLPVSLAILIFYIFPLLTLLFGSILDREIPRLITLIAMLIALLGLAIVLGVGPVAMDPWGIMFAGLAAICAAVGFIVSERKVRAVKPIVMIYHSTKAGLVLALIFLLVEGRG
ncbi:MAG: EamA family transporter, partial [Fimbriimonadaceae bacterium]|nr:EamA family transporter [Alphaproteobacteria bacterium]